MFGVGDMKTGREPFHVTHRITCERGLPVCGADTDTALAAPIKGKALIDHQTTSGNTAAGLAGGFVEIHRLA